MCAGKGKMYDSSLSTDAEKDPFFYIHKQRRCERSTWAPSDARRTRLPSGGGSADDLRAPLPGVCACPLSACVPRAILIVTAAEVAAQNVLVVSDNDQLLSAFRVRQAL